MINKKGCDYIIQPYSVREQNLKDTIKELGLGNKFLHIGTINDGVGHSGSDTEIDALVVTKETVKGGDFVNVTRVKNGLKELPIIVCNVISHTVDKISSSSIRKKILNEISVEQLDSLFQSWNVLTFQNLKISGETSSKWFSILRDYYMQSWRKYHTLNHIYWFINKCEELFKEGKIKDRINVTLAIWFHDVIYVPSRSDNEDRSCVKFKEFCDDIERALVLENTFNCIDPDKICYYIMCTKHHFDEKIYTDSDLNYLLDLDLYTFSLETNAYLETNKGIKFEYTHHLTEEEFKTGRTNFLQKVLGKTNIFRSEEFINKYEAKARENINKEIEILNNN